MYTSTMSIYSNDQYAKGYGEFAIAEKYNERYKTQPRFSDLELLSILHKYVELLAISGEARVLDVGCGNGNLLMQIRKAFPDFKLYGQDLSTDLIENNLTDPDLEGIEFFSGDLREPGFGKQENEGYDVIIASAVLQTLTSPEEYEEVLGMLAVALRPNGLLILFEGFFESDAVNSVVTKYSYAPSHSKFLNQMQYSYLSYSHTTRILEQSGMNSVAFEPFFVPIELTREPGNPRKTFTIRADSGRYLSMLEMVSQPWCFCVAQKTLSTE